MMGVIYYHYFYHVKVVRVPSFSETIAICFNHKICHKQDQNYEFSNIFDKFIDPVSQLKIVSLFHGFTYKFQK